MTASTGQTQRMIFTNVTLTEAEQKHWDAFLEFCSVNNLDVPEKYKDKDHMLMRYLQASRFDYHKAQAAIIQHASWVAQS